MVEFFGTELARKFVEDGTKADLLIGNNVLAHVPDLNDFVGGMSIVLSPEGVITMEFPHLLQLIEQNQFDTIYHEHFSYFSLLTVTTCLRRPSIAHLRRRADRHSRRIVTDLCLPRRLRRARNKSAGARS